MSAPPRAAAALVFGLAGAASGMVRCADVPADCLLFVASAAVVAALFGFLFGDRIARARSRWSAARWGAAAALLAAAVWVTVVVLATAFPDRGTHGHEVPEFLVFALGFYLVVAGWAVALAGGAAGYFLHARQARG